jgi:hypothetical protein
MKLRRPVTSLIGIVLEKLGRKDSLILICSFLRREWSFLKEEKEEMVDSH